MKSGTVLFYFIFFYPTIYTPYFCTSNAGNNTVSLHDYMPRNRCCHGADVEKETEKSNLIDFLFFFPLCLYFIEVLPRNYQTAT